MQGIAGSRKTVARNEMKELVGSGKILSFIQNGMVSQKRKLKRYFCDKRKCFWKSILLAAERTVTSGKWAGRVGSRHSVGDYTVAHERHDWQ